MAVLEQITLPAQPSAGSVVYTPLGGDGYTAPSSMYDVSIQATGDATGGNVVLQAIYDPRWTGLINWLCATRDNGAQDIGCLMSLTTAEQTGQGLCDFRLATFGISGGGVCKLWEPPPTAFTGTQTFNPTISATWANSDGSEFNFTMQIYNFRKRAREVTPMYLLAQNLPR